EKLRESLRAYIRAAPWIPLILERFTNIGIVVGLKMPLILDALQHLTLPMTIEDAMQKPDSALLIADLRTTKFVQSRSHCV
ncbi:hypothetical protein C2S52_001320, partial [Perilla frutescens var. hirtella]